MVLSTVLGLLAAVSFGVSDFVAGFAARRLHFMLVTLLTQTVAGLAILIVVLAMHPLLPSAAPLFWGALSGVGSATGSVALYRGLGRGQMSVAGPLSAVGSAAIPAVVGFFLGDRLTALAILGVLLALPAIWLVSKPAGAAGAGSLRAGSADGIIAGVGFALLFVCLNQAGDTAGLWPVATGQWTSLLLLVIAVGIQRPKARIQPGHTAWLIVVAGALSVSATVLYFSATHTGNLTIAAVLTSIYPGFTVILAGIVLKERPSRLQLAGLGLCAVAIIAIVL